MKKISARLTALLLSFAMLATMIPTSFAMEDYQKLTPQADVLSGDSTGKSINNGTLVYDSEATEYPITYRVKVDTTPIGKDYDAQLTDYAERAIETGYCYDDGTPFEDTNAAKTYLLGKIKVKGALTISFNYDASVFPSVTLTKDVAQQAFVAANPNFADVFEVSEATAKDGKVNITIHTLKFDGEQMAGTELNKYIVLLNRPLIFNTPKGMFNISAEDYDKLAAVDGKTVDTSSLRVASTIYYTPAKGEERNRSYWSESDTSKKDTSFSFGTEPSDPDPSDPDPSDPDPSDPDPSDPDSYKITQNIVTAGEPDPQYVRVDSAFAVVEDTPITYKLTLAEISSIQDSYTAILNKQKASNATLSGSINLSLDNELVYDSQGTVTWDKDVSSVFGTPVISSDGKTLTIPFTAGATTDAFDTMLASSPKLVLTNCYYAADTMKFDSLEKAVMKLDVNTADSEITVTSLSKAPGSLGSIVLSGGTPVSILVKGSRGISAPTKGTILVGSPMNSGILTESDGVLYLDKDGKAPDDTKISYTLQLDASSMETAYNGLKNQIKGKLPSTISMDDVIGATYFPEGSSFTFKLTPKDSNQLTAVTPTSIGWSEGQDTALTIFDETPSVKVEGNSIIFTINVKKDLEAEKMEAALKDSSWLKNLSIEVKDGFELNGNNVKPGDEIVLNGDVIEEDPTSQVLISFHDVGGLTSAQIASILQKNGFDIVDGAIPVPITMSTATAKFTTKKVPEAIVKPSIIVNTSVVPGNTNTGTLYVFPSIDDQTKYELPKTMEKINYTLGLDVSDIKTKFDAMVDEAVKEAQKVYGSTLTDEQIRSFVIKNTNFPKGEITLTLTPDAALTPTSEIDWDISDANLMNEINKVFEKPTMSGNIVTIKVKPGALAYDLNTLLAMGKPLQLKTAYNTETAKVTDADGQPITNSVKLEGTVSGSVTTNGYEGNNVTIMPAEIAIGSTKAEASFDVKPVKTTTDVTVTPKMTVNDPKVLKQDMVTGSSLLYSAAGGNYTINYKLQLNASDIKKKYDSITGPFVTEILNKAPMGTTQAQAESIINHNTFFTQGGMVLTFKYDSDLTWTGNATATLTAPGVTLSDLFVLDGNKIVAENMTNDSATRTITIKIPVKEGVSAQIFNASSNWMANLQLDLENAFTLANDKAAAALTYNDDGGDGLIWLSNGDVTGSVGLTFSEKVNVSGLAEPQSISISSDKKPYCNFGVIEAKTVIPYILVDSVHTTTPEEYLSSGAHTSFAGMINYDKYGLATVDYTLGLNASSIKTAYDDLLSDTIKQIKDKYGEQLTEQQARSLITYNTFFNGSMQLSFKYDNDLKYVPGGTLDWVAPTQATDVFGTPTISSVNTATHTVVVSVPINKDLRARVLDNILVLNENWLDDLQISMKNSFTVDLPNDQAAHTYYLKEGKVSGQIDLSFSNNINANGINPPTIFIVSIAAGSDHLSTVVNSDADAYFTRTGYSSGGGGGSSTKYTLTFVTNGGTSIPTYSTTKDKTVVDLADYVTTREGYTFDGWYSDKELTNKITSVTLGPSTTVYAKWIKAVSLNTEDHYAYIIGYVDGTIRPEANITRAESATIFFRLLTQKSRENYWTKDNTFIDIPSKTVWYNNAVSTMENAGIIKGYPNRTFKADNAITRAEFAAIISRFNIDKTPTGTASFSDISGHWAASDIKRAAELGWIKGYDDGTFRPDNYITRAEAVTLINRVLGRNHLHYTEDMLPGMNTWTDNGDTDEYYYFDMQEASNSHDYKIVDKVTANDTKLESWTDLVADPDWKALELAMSMADDVYSKIEA